MLLRVQAEGKIITAHERPDGSWNLKLYKPKMCSLHFHMGDVLIMTNKRGQEVMAHKVLAFVPHLRYGGFTRSGHAVTELLWTSDSGSKPQTFPMESAFVFARRSE
jgi:hypothetical protein